MTRLLVPTADTPYFLWQVVVHAHSCLLQEATPTYLIYHPAAGPSALLQEVAAGLPFEVLTFPDPRPAALRHGYNPCMKPWLVSAHHTARPGDEGPFLLVDPDCVLTRPAPPLPPAWSGSDTDSYTGPNYLRSKGGGLWEALCDLAGADPTHAAQFAGIGAQLVIPGGDAHFWAAAAELSVTMFELMTGEVGRFHPAGHEHPVQAWCAEMYATQLLAIAHGHHTRADPVLDFTWATGTQDEWNRNLLFHDAGVVDPTETHFRKTDWQTAPFHQPIQVAPVSASANYVALIRGCETRWPELTHSMSRHA